MHVCKLCTEGEVEQPCIISPSLDQQKATKKPRQSVFASEKALTQHIRRVHGEKRHVCNPGCGKGYGLKKDLDYHVKSCGKRMGLEWEELEKKRNAEASVCFGTGQSIITTPTSLQLVLDSNGSVFAVPVLPISIKSPKNSTEVAENGERAAVGPQKLAPILPKISAGGNNTGVPPVLKFLKRWKNLEPLDGNPSPGCSPNKKRKPAEKCTSDSEVAAVPLCRSDDLTVSRDLTSIIKPNDQSAEGSYCKCSAGLESIAGPASPRVAAPFVNRKRRRVRRPRMRSMAVQTDDMTGRGASMVSPPHLPANLCASQQVQTLASSFYCHPPRDQQRSYNTASSYESSYPPVSHNCNAFSQTPQETTGQPPHLAHAGSQIDFRPIHENPDYRNLNQQEPVFVHVQDTWTQYQWSAPAPPVPRDSFHCQVSPSDFADYGAATRNRNMSCQFSGTTDRTWEPIYGQPSSSHGHHSSQSTMTAVNAADAGTTYCSPPGYFATSSHDNHHTEEASATNYAHASTYCGPGIFRESGTPILCHNSTTTTHEVANASTYCAPGYFPDDLQGPSSGAAALQMQDACVAADMQADCFADGWTNTTLHDFVDLQGYNDESSSARFSADTASTNVCSTGVGMDDSFWSAAPNQNHQPRPGSSIGIQCQPDSISAFADQGVGTMPAEFRDFGIGASLSAGIDIDSQCAAMMLNIETQTDLNYEFESTPVGTRRFMAASSCEHDILHQQAGLNPGCIPSVSRGAEDKQLQTTTSSSMTTSPSPIPVPSNNGPHGEAGEGDESREDALNTPFPDFIEAGCGSMNSLDGMSMLMLQNTQTQTLPGDLLGVRGNFGGGEFAEMQTQTLTTCFFSEAGAQVEDSASQTAV